MNNLQLTNLAASAADLIDVAVTDGSLRFTAALEPGIYRLSALIDAAAFDWERLYYTLDLYQNKGQRTGPWDFDLRSHNEPTLPAWWMNVNGKRLGLVIPRRPGITAIKTRRMQVNVCFAVRNAGDVAIDLERYNDHAGVVIDHLQLARAYEQEPADTDVTGAQSLAASQTSERVWERWHATVHAPGSCYSKLMPRLIAAAKAQYDRPTQNAKDNAAAQKAKMFGAEALPLLAYAHLAEGDQEALDLLIKGVRGLLGMAAWGNPFEDGYGHNCDMNAAERIEPLTYIYHWEAEALREAGLHEALRDRLDKQMAFFYDACLLSEDYWGGSLLQDHGHRSVGRFGVAAANMLGVLDDAPLWFRFVVHRMQRVIDALPNDGGMPFTSYHLLHLYMDDMVSWRAALRHVTGEDLFDNPKFPPITRFVVNRLHEPTRRVMTVITRGDRKDFYGGWGFLSAMADKNGDRDAARLREILIHHYEQEGVSIPIRPVATALAMIDLHRDGVTPEPLAPDPFDVRVDSGLVNYRPRGRDANVAMRCVSTPAISSATRTFCPCDRAIDVQLEGHFTVAVGDQTLLLSAEGGYRMRTSLGCALLIDGQGQYADEDYAMGVPDMPLRGYCIEAARYDEATETAYVRMRLDAAYRREAQLIRYDREFHLRPGGMTVRDTVVSAAEHEYSWYFQTYARRTIAAIGEGAYRISDGDAALTLAGRAVQTPLMASVGDTDVVWSYSNENDSQPFKHVHYRTSQKLRTMTAEFVIAW